MRLSELKKNSEVIVDNSSKEYEATAYGNKRMTAYEMLEDVVKNNTNLNNKRIYSAAENGEGRKRIIIDLPLLDIKEKYYKWRKEKK